MFLASSSLRSKLIFNPCTKPSLSNTLEAAWIYLLISSGIKDISSSLGSSGEAAPTGKLGFIVVIPSAFAIVAVSGICKNGLMSPVNSFAPGLAIAGLRLPPKAPTKLSISWKLT